LRVGEALKRKRHCHSDPAVAGEGSLTISSDSGATQPAIFASLNMTAPERFNDPTLQPFNA
jgi:hypothetical protein